MSEVNSSERNQSQNHRRREYSPSRRHNNAKRRDYSPSRRYFRRHSRDESPSRHDGQKSRHSGTRKEGNDSKTSSIYPHRKNSDTLTSKSNAQSAEAEYRVDTGIDDMAAVMGFSGFGSTKGEHVKGNIEKPILKPKVKRKYRQYMHLNGGFKRHADMHD